MRLMMSMILITLGSGDGRLPGGTNTWINVSYTPPPPPPPPHTHTHTHTHTQKKKKKTLMCSKAVCISYVIYHIYKWSDAAITGVNVVLRSCIIHWLRSRRKNQQQFTQCWTWCKLNAGSNKVFSCSYLLFSSSLCDLTGHIVLAIQHVYHAALWVYTKVWYICICNSCVDPLLAKWF